MSHPFLRLDDVSFGYGRRVVGSGLSLACDEGQAVALLGPNGSGKTTLFKTILGLIPPLGGRVTVDGEDTRHWSARRRARLFGYVPQSSPGYFPFSVTEMVMMGRTARLGAFSAPSEADGIAAARVIDRLGIGRLAERSYTELSGGERQLVLIARALAQEPRILILDEPTASLDFGNQIMVVETVRHLVEEGLTVILST
ncbi:ABC transporter ATP-binding protein, partial [Lutibaculum baratangense]|uniref:ABC transporter ATP-binding protein n=1 Tax=Lutibaculum baratangense TaxID=1358440 RepID=UPI00058E8447